MFFNKINMKCKVHINQYIFVVCLSVCDKCIGVAISNLQVVCKIITCSTEMAIFAQCLVMCDTLHCQHEYVLCGYMYYAIIIIII